MTTFTKPLLLADNVGGTSPTNASVGLELQSTKSAFLVSRLTTAQINALTLANGMIVYNTDDDEFNLAQGGVWSNFSPNATQTVTVPITSAQLLGMNGEFVPIIPAPGQGKAIVVNFFTFDYAYNTTAYQNGGTIVLVYGNTGTGATSPMAAAALTANAGTLTIVSAPATPRDSATIANQPVVLANNTAPFITGDGTAKVTVFYTIITL